MIRAHWQQRGETKHFYAMVVTCLECGKEDAINSEDKEWRCPACLKLWLVEDLKTGRARR